MKRIQAIVEDETFDKLEKEAKAESRKLSPHVNHILKKHVSKQEVSHKPKNETK
jgi:hypothetical protein